VTVDDEEVDVEELLHVTEFDEEADLQARIWNRFQQDQRGGSMTKTVMRASERLIRLSLAGDPRLSDVNRNSRASKTDSQEGGKERSSLRQSGVGPDLNIKISTRRSGVVNRESTSRNSTIMEAINEAVRNSTARRDRQAGINSSLYSSVDSL
jgi:hypothetical protein